MVGSAEEVPDGGGNQEDGRGKEDETVIEVEKAESEYDEAGEQEPREKVAKKWKQRAESSVEPMRWVYWHVPD
jgi:hypothetical protein